MSIDPVSSVTVRPVATLTSEPHVQVAPAEKQFHPLSAENVNHADKAHRAQKELDDLSEGFPWKG